MRQSHRYGVRVEDYELNETDLARSILRGIGEGFVSSGILDPDGLSGEEFEAAVRDHLALLLKSNEVEFVPIIDHQGSLLRQARDFAARDEPEFAIVFFATWIEHWLNWMILWKSELGGIQKKDATELLRQPLHNKVGILWTLLFGQALDTGIATGVLEVATWRNAFVHYKWSGVDETEPYAERNRRRIERAEEVVVALTGIRNEMALHGADHLFSDLDEEL